MTGGTACRNPPRLKLLHERAQPRLFRLTLTQSVTDGQPGEARRKAGTLTNGIGRDDGGIGSFHHRGTDYYMVSKHITPSLLWLTRLLATTAA